MSATLLIPALLLDAALGEPKWLWSRWPHPAVRWAASSAGQTAVSTGRQPPPEGNSRHGRACACAAALGASSSAIPDGGLLEILIAAILLAQKSLVEHVRAVADALRLSLGRRPPHGRPDRGPRHRRDDRTRGRPRRHRKRRREPVSDGVIAPALFFLIFGLPALLVYKITNTADSMIGHRTPRHEEFGWAAARLDDVLNLDPGPPDRAPDRAHPRLDRRQARSCATRRCTARPTPAGPRPRWPSVLNVVALRPAQLQRRAARLSLGLARRPRRPRPGSDRRRLLARSGGPGARCSRSPSCSR